MMKHLSDNLTHWDMLGQEAVNDPIRAVGGNGLLFLPNDTKATLTGSELARAQPETLITYYSPIFVQQRLDPAKQKYPYPPEYDMVGTAHIRPETDGKLKSYVTGAPTVYAIFKKVPIEGRDHIQLTYTAWYPAHPKMKMIDLEEADIDSCVVRITLDSKNIPVCYETIAACGCFHKVFFPTWVEQAARQAYGPPESGKQFSIERKLSGSIEWEVGGLVDSIKDHPTRPVVFLKAGDHKVIGMGNGARIKLPPPSQCHGYELASYAQLYAIPVDQRNDTAAFFDMEDGGKVRGAARSKEKFLLQFVGVDNAGHPRADDQIKMHFDQSTWGDPTIYHRYLRLPLGIFE
jgi:hypothetical protein